MIHDSQWDAIMDWMENSTNEIAKTYVTNSTGMGWYNGIEGNSDHFTGKDLNGGKNKVFNIYDLAGNYYEWTQQASSDESKRIMRGSFFGETDASAQFASNSKSPVPDYGGPAMSSRLQLYIK